ncbi:MAG: amidohydrolase, partial [Candidatus Limnocylindria bacterium]|nr:amidohydrolase [Candidatus Limnocylindria bacterium]
TLDGALARIAEHVRGLPEGAWLEGGRFDKNHWGRWPTAAELDRVTAGHPAALRSRDGHARWLNSAALRLAGVGSGTPDPEGGALERDAGGAPTGILKENANRLADAVVPPPTADECLEAVRRGQDEAWRRGLTGIEDFEQENALAAFTRLDERGELGLRVSMGIPHASLGRALALGYRTGLGGDWLRTGHLKIFTDGALGSQTAALEEPYAGTDDRGILTIVPGTLRADVARAAAGGIAVAIHAIGDRAVHAALDAIEPTRAEAPQLRQKIEHLQLLRAEDLGRFAVLGIVASMQPIHATSDRDLADRHWGAARTARAYPWRTLLASGARLAFGSDAPVEPIAPLAGIHAAVARRRPGDRTAWHPEQRLTLAEALAAYAAGPAWALGRESELGMLAPGMRADATILDRDAFALPEQDLLDVRIAGTLTGGLLRFAGGLG